MFRDCSAGQDKKGTNVNISGEAMPFTLVILNSFQDPCRESASSGAPVITEHMDPETSSG
jgi:hypothetical protein